MIKHIPYTPGLIVLDLACHTGTLFQHLQNRTGRTWGVTPRQSEIDAPNLRERAIAAASERLPFADAAFDAAILHERIGAPRRTQRILRQIERVLRPRGRLIWQRSRPEQNKIAAGSLLDATGFALLAQEATDYLTIPVIELFGRLPGLSRSSALKIGLKIAIAIDGALSNIPALQPWSRHVIIVAEKTSRR